MSVFFLECAKRKYLEFTIKENMRGKRAKDETLRKAFYELWFLSGHW